MDRQGTLKSEITALRGSEFAEFLQAAADYFNLEFSFKVKKGWFRERVKFKMKGSETDLRAVWDLIQDTVKEYNQD